MLVTAGLIILNIFWVNVSVLGQNIEKTEKCRWAIANTKSKLTTSLQLEIPWEETRKVDYSDYPEDRSYRHDFGMEGEAVASVMNSPVLMNSLAERIIHNCDSIGMVSFGKYMTDWTTVYGLMPSGKVERFECPADYPGMGDPNWRGLIWGESC